MSEKSIFVVERLGGNTGAAKFFAVTAGAISQWRSADLPPARWLELLRRRPDIFWAAQAAPAETPEPIKEAA